jgi:hypothetical protein
MVEIAWDKIQGQGRANGSPNVPGVELLRKAVVSLSVTFFGSQTRQPAMTNRGYRQYGEVLQQLNSHIAHDQLQTTNETILTAATCMLLEIFLPTGPTNFLKHARGIEAILELRGPPTSATKDTDFIVTNFRAVAIIGALADGRASIWAKPEWKTLPPVSLHHDSLIKDQLWGLLADCTQATSERNRRFANGHIQQDPLLIATVRALLQRSETIYLEWKIYNHSLENGGVLFRDSDLHVPTRSSIIAYMLCNAAHVCILQLAHSMDPTLSHGRSRHEAATNIVRCLELNYFEKENGNFTDNTVGFFATKVAWEGLGGMSSLEGTRLSRIVRASSKGTFAIRALEHGPDEFKEVYPKLTERTILGRWNSPLWTHTQAPNSELLSPNQQKSIDAQTPLVAERLPLSSLCSLDAPDGCLPPSFFRSPHALPPASVADDVLDSSSSALASPKSDQHAYVPGPFDFTDPLLGDIF